MCPPGGSQRIPGSGSLFLRREEIFLWFYFLSGAPAVIKTSFKEG